MRAVHVERITVRNPMDAFFPNYSYSAPAAGPRSPPTASAWLAPESSGRSCATGKTYTAFFSLQGSGMTARPPFPAL